MDFEVKNLETVGGITTVNDTTMSINVNITIGVVGCTYEDIVSIKTIAYEFATSLTIAEATSLIPAWADTWVSTNYPAI